VVYNEFIADRNHIHMNSTCWLTLTEFVKYLGREGKCKVEETEKGWFITLIRVSTAVARQPGASSSALLWQHSRCHALSSSWAELIVDLTSSCTSLGPRDTGHV
jgi:hypothetical protein